MTIDASSALLTARAELGYPPNSAPGSVRALSQLSNARFARLRSAGSARFYHEAENREFVFAGINPDNFDGLVRSFDAFVDLFKDACDGILPKQRFREANELFESDVVPALKKAGIEVVDAGDYSNSNVRVMLAGALGAPSPDEAGQYLSASFSLKIPLRQGFRKYWGDAAYEAHARFEEVLHIFQHLNEAPLTTMGADLERLLITRDKALLSLLTKSWNDFERRGRFVRENDIMGAYEEYGIGLPGIFLFAYDRRAVRNFVLSGGLCKG